MYAEVIGFGDEVQVKKNLSNYPLTHFDTDFPGPAGKKRSSTRKASQESGLEMVVYGDSNSHIFIIANQFNPFFSDTQMLSRFVARSHGHPLRFLGH